MDRMHQYLGSLIVGAALIAPVGLRAATNLPEGVQIKNAAQVSVQIRTRRYYDPYRRDYHVWNSNENRAYRHWAMEERHEARVRAFNRRKRAQQAEYWRWRHAHADWR
jgi:hypothetical protein